MVARGELHLVGPTPSLDELPAVLTIAEAAKVLRIGRGAAYALAHQYLATDGQQGLPVMRLGRSLRVPRAKLVRLLDVATEPDHAADG